MPSQADVERIQAANRGVVALAERDLDDFWAALDLTNPDAARNALESFLPQLVAQYGEVAATVAADWYEDLRYEANVAGQFGAVMAEGVPDAAVVSQVRYAAGGLFPDSPLDTLGLLRVALSKYALQPGRDTVTQSVAADPGRPRFARVPSGAKTCAFCLMLASRGAVYVSKAAAGGTMHKYHGKCDCVPTPLWADSQLPGRYNPDALYERYSAARQAAQSGNTKEILAELRQRDGSN